MRLIQYAAVIIGGLVGIFFRAEAAKVDLDVYASRFDSIPIAILPFRSLNSITLRHNEPWVIIADDLSFYGRFFVFRSEKFDSLVFLGKQIGIYIDGEYRVDADTIEMECYVRETETKEIIVGKKYRGALKHLRTMAHKYSNAIVEMLLGEKGYFETKVVYVRQYKSAKELYLMDYDGYNHRQLTSNNSVNIFPVFAGENSIMWVSFLKGKPDIYKGSIFSTEVNAIISGRYVQSSPDVSVIEDKIAFASAREGNMEIYTADIDGTNVKRLTFERAIDTSPSWSPNGYQIAFTSDRSGTPQIYVMDADGANTRRITFEGGYNDSPAWSPKGDKIAYSSMRNGKFDIYVVNVDGSLPQRITSDWGDNEYPTWSPDGFWIMFTKRSGTGSDIYAVRADGRDSRKITAVGNAYMPNWSRHF